MPDINKQGAITFSIPPLHNILQLQNKACVAIKMSKLQRTSEANEKRKQKMRTPSSRKFNEMHRADLYEMICQLEKEKEDLLIALNDMTTQFMQCCE